MAAPDLKSAALRHAQVKRIAARLSARPIAATFRTRDLSSVILWMAAANTLLFAFMFGVARGLEPGEYSLFASLFGLVALMNVFFSGIQMSAAAAIARAPETQRHEMARSWWPTVIVASIVLFCSLVVLSPAVAVFLHAPDIGSVLAAACFATVLLPWAFLLGAFQGSMRFREFALLTFLHAALRLIALLAIFFSSSASAVLAAVTAMAVFPIVCGLWLLQKAGARTQGPVAAGAPAPAWLDRRLGLAILVAMTVGFPSLGDVILVRHVYSPDAAGLYAGLALTGRIVLFLGLAVTSVLFPGFVSATPLESRSRLRTGLIVMTTVTVPAAIFLSVAPATTLGLALGSGYAAAASLVPAYTMSSVFFSIAAVFAFFHLASSDARYVLFVVSPFLLLEFLAPQLVASDIAQFVLVNLLISVAFVAASAAATFLGPFVGMES